MNRECVVRTDFEDQDVLSLMRWRSCRGLLDRLQLDETLSCVGLSNFSELTTHQDCSGDLDLSSFACMLKTPSLVISVVRIRDVGRFVLSHLVLCGFSARTVSPSAG